MEIEFVSLVALKTSIENNYPGGLDAFALDSGGPYLEDEHLAKVGFMATAPACELADQLERLNCVFAIVDRTSLLPDWLVVGAYDDCGAVWKKGADRGKLIRFEDIMVRARDIRIASLEELEAVLAEFGLTHSQGPPPESEAGGPVLRCSRDLAQVDLEVMMDGGVPIGLYSVPDLTRRQFLRDDLALVRDLREHFAQITGA